MIYFFYGSDVEKVRAKAFEWVEKARTKEPNVAYVRLTKEEITPGALLEAASSNSLFAKRTLTLIDDPFAKVKAESEDPSTSSGQESDGDPSTSVLEDYLDVLADSGNAIVILAPKLLATKAKKLSAKAKLTYQFEQRLAPSLSRGFNSNLVNALASRSREKLWIEIERALWFGDAPEMLHGLLHWKARDLMEKGSRSWTPSESRQLSLDLLALLQESRRGGLGLSQALERFALSL